MPFINLTGLPTEPTKCAYCDKPFQHTTRVRKVKGSNDPNEVDIEHITAHPECKKSHIKMERIKSRIVKAKKTLHDLRASQLNLEFDMFMKQQLKMDDDTDEIFVMLKEKEIL